jgi:hypothetical protein
VASTGEVWAWDGHPVGYKTGPPPKPIEALQGVKVDALAVRCTEALALADDGSVYVWHAERVVADPENEFTPQRIPGLRVACGL